MSNSFNNYRKYSSIFTQDIYVHRKPIARFSIDSSFANNILIKHNNTYPEIYKKLVSNSVIIEEEIDDESFRIPYDSSNIKLEITPKYSAGYVTVENCSSYEERKRMSRYNTYTFKIPDKSRRITINGLNMNKANVTLTYTENNYTYEEDNTKIAVNIPRDAIKAQITYTSRDYDDQAVTTFYADGVRLGNAVNDDKTHILNLPSGTTELLVKISDNLKDDRSYACISNISVSCYTPNTNLKVPIVENSYDKDHTSLSNKGIVEWEWRVIKEDGSTTVFNNNTNRSEGIKAVQNNLSSMNWKNATILLRVRDMEQAWSDWTSKCILVSVLDPDADDKEISVNLPIADFILDYDILRYKTQKQGINDESSDPQGLSLVYIWKVYKEKTLILSSMNNDINNELNEKILSNGTGKYSVKLMVVNTKGLNSDEITKSFDVVLYNDEPTVNFNLVSNENPAWTFPKTLGLYTLRYRPINTLYSEEYVRFDTNIVDPNTDNTGFIYNWKLERFAVKDINNISGTATNTYNYTTQFPFVNSFKNQGLSWGAYRITLKATDKPPIPPYTSTDAKSVAVTKCYYIVPQISLTGNFTKSKTEVAPGDTIILKATTNLLVDYVDCTFAGKTYTLNKITQNSSNAYWVKDITIPEDINSGTYNMQFAGKTTYGGNGNVTREIKDNVAIDIVALKLINFRITNIVNHPYITFPYTKNMLISNLIPYKTGYYVTIQIDSKGKPDNVYGRIDVGNNNKTDQVISMTKVSTGNKETWQGKFYTTTLLPINTVISIKLDCNKGATTYNYNEKENWVGRSLIIKGSALQDGRINLTN